MAGALSFLVWLVAMAVFLWSSMRDNVVLLTDDYSLRTKLLLAPVLVGWVPFLYFTS